MALLPLIALVTSLNLPQAMDLPPDPPPGHPSPGEPMVLTEFEDNLWGWTTVLDGVMGGRSQGALRLLPGSLEFRGSLNTNGGGFASVRSGDRLTDLHAFQGIRVRVRGDGRRYTLRLREAGARYGVTYRADFPTRDAWKTKGGVAGPWETVWLPFDAFTPKWRGRQLELPPLDTSRVCGLGLTLADGVDGPFRIQWDQVAAYPRFELVQWRGSRRALVLVAPDLQAGEALAWSKALAAAQEGAAARDLTLVGVDHAGTSFAGSRPLTQEETKVIRATLKVDHDQTLVAVLGKDGSVHPLGAGPPDIRALFGLVDRLPCRRAEVAEAEESGG